MDSSNKIAAYENALAAYEAARRSHIGDKTAAVLALCDAYTLATNIPCAEQAYCYGCGPIHRIVAVVTNALEAERSLAAEAATSKRRKAEPENNVE